MKNSIKLYLGDCSEIMKEIKDNSIDAIIADPPYNISRKTNFHTMKGHRGTSMNYGDWDKEADILSWIDQIPRILKQGSNVIIFNDWKNLGDIAKKMRKNNIEPKRCLVLNKSNPAPFNRDRLFVNDVEFAIWGVYGKGWTFNRKEKLERCILNTTVQSKKFHPTMKDTKVIKKLVKVLSNENDIILDPFMGSGTTGIACKMTDRKFIGIEMKEEYMKIAVARIKAYKKEECEVSYLQEALNKTYHSERNNRSNY